MLLFFLQIVPAAVGGAESKLESWGTPQGDDLPWFDEDSEEVLDEAQVEASEMLQDFADWIDTFFDDGRFSNEVNTSRATIKLSFGYSKDDDFEVKPRVDIRIKLPKLSNRAQLVIMADSDEDFDIEDNPINDRPRNEDSAGSNDFTAAVRFFLRESDKYNLSFDTGASWNYLYGSLRFRTVHHFNSWLGRFTNRLRWYTDDGWENRAAYDLETQMSEELLFRTTSGVHWYEEEDGYPHSQYFRLFQKLSSYQAMSFELGFFMDTEPSYKMTDTQVLLKYRQRFYRDWLVLEISPRVTFPEDNNREPNPGIILKLEATVGHKSGEEGYRKVFR